VIGALLENQMTDQPLSDTLFCANHPQTPTSLRCNKCGKPICAKCAKRTPVGYRCQNCVVAQQQIFETAEWYDYVIAAVVAAPLAGLAGFFVGQLGLFVIFLAPVAGGAIAEVVRAAVRRRRGKYLTLLAAGAFVAGCLLLVLIALFFQGGLSILWVLLYTAIAASTFYARLRGISIN
jgi:hypothetical protein